MRNIMQYLKTYNLNNLKIIYCESWDQKSEGE